MAIELHGVDLQAVLSAIPFDTSGLDANSTPVSTTEIEEWIEDGAGILNALLERMGIDPAADMKPAGTKVLRRGIVGYAAAEALSAASFTGAKYQKHKDAFDAVDERIRTEPQSLGHTQSADSVIVSNIDTTDPTEKKWDSTNFKGW